MEDNKHTSVNGKIVPFLQAQCVIFYKYYE